MVSVATRHPPDMDVLVDTHLPDSDRIKRSYPQFRFSFEDGLYRKRSLFLLFIFMYCFDMEISAWAF
jgi:hypothetical protein